MRCPDCRLDNADDRRFCIECGRVLQRHCPVCAFLNVPEARYCGGCGADRLTEAERDAAAVRGATPGRLERRVEPEAVSERARSRPFAPSSAERRQLTVMFCDLAGSTAMSQRLDPEDLGDVNRAYQDTATRAIERFGGYVARYMGDGVLAYFGYPRAHEDDAERAVRAGLALVDEVRALSADLGARKGVELSVRVGIATGLVVVGDVVGQASAQEHTVVGETPNLAARLQSLASVDTVLVAESTRRLLGRQFELDDLGAHDVKGFSDPVRVWRVSSRGGDGVNDDFDQAESERTPLVGRDADLALLQDRWERARSGEGQVVLLCGEAGLGKTRLARELCQRVSNEAEEVIRYDAVAFHEGSALYPVIRSLAARAGITDGDTDTARAEKLERLLTPSAADPKLAVALLAPLFSIRVPDGYPTVELEGAARLGRTFAVLLDELVERAKAGPVLLIADGMHAADPTTLSFVDRIVELAPEHRLLVLLTFRPPLERSWSGKRNVGMLDLGRLRRQDVESVARAIAGDPPIAQAVLSLVAERTDGVPLFVEELTRALVASGDLVERDGERALGSGRHAAAIPTTVQDSLMARLDRMGDAKMLAQVAAVLGREVPVRLLGRVLERPTRELLTALGPLVTGQILTRRGSEDATVVAFRQALLRDAAYESLLLSRRRELHARAAEALEELYPDVVEREPEVLARHHALAGNAVRALDAWERAGHRAVERVAHAEAIGHFTEALAAFEELPSGDRSGPDAVQRKLSLQLALVGSCRMSQRLEPGLEQLERMEALAKEHQQLEMLARVHALRGGIYFVMGRIHESLSEQEEALRVAREAGSAELTAQALGGLGDSSYQRTDVTRAKDYYERCIAISREHGLERIEAAHLPMLGLMQAFDLDFETARRTCEEALALAKRTGHRRAAMVGCSSLAQILYETGPRDEADRTREEGIEHATALGAYLFIATAKLFHARFLAGTGEHDAAWQLLDEAEHLMRGSPMLRTANAFLLGPRSLLARDAAELRSILAEAKPLLRQEGGFGIVFLHGGFEGTLRARMWAEAAELIDVAEGAHLEETGKWLALQLQRARALLSWGRDGPTDAGRQELEGLLDRVKQIQFGSLRPLLEAALDGRWPAKPFRSFEAE